MQIQKFMTIEPICCTPGTSLQEIAQLMVSHHCGAIPIVDSLDTKRPIGIITDRDITCRSLAAGINPLELAAEDCMSSSVMTVRPEASVEECCRIMEAKRVRRLPVVDAAGHCTGIVAQADIARNAPEQETGEVLRALSEPTQAASLAVV